MSDDQQPEWRTTAEVVAENEAKTAAGAAAPAEPRNPVLVWLWWQFGLSVLGWLIAGPMLAVGIDDQVRYHDRLDGAVIAGAFTVLVFILSTAGSFFAALLLHGIHWMRRRDAARASEG